MCHEWVCVWLCVWWERERRVNCVLWIITNFKAVALVKNGRPSLHPLREERENHRGDGVCVCVSRCQEQRDKETHIHTLLVCWLFTCFTRGEEKLFPRWNLINQLLQSGFKPLLILVYENRRCLQNVPLFHQNKPVMVAFTKWFWSPCWCLCKTSDRYLQTFCLQAESCIDCR